MSTLHIVEHPLIKHKVSMLRNSQTGFKEFREVVEEIATLLCYEATRDLELSKRTIPTPNGEFEVDMLDDDVNFGIVPVLRAGIGMVNGMHTLLPTAKVGHIGLYRDPDTLEPTEYYCKLPVDCENRKVFLIDPMLATGGTAVMSIDALKKRGVKDIKFLCLISCPEGVKRLQEVHPDVEIYTASHDSHLNEHGYIIPGLGDAGDRLFGTK
ncbi:MAG: uracil phosphoribosyltransferase [Lachnospirales bacterium]